MPMIVITLTCCFYTDVRHYVRVLIIHRRTCISRFIDTVNNSWNASTSAYYQYDQYVSIVKYAGVLSVHGRNNNHRHREFTWLYQ